MNRANLWSASLMMVALTTMACGQDQESPFESKQESTLASRQDALASLPKALILGSTVVGGADSVEAVAARQIGLEVTVITDEQWAAMTSSQFSTYRVIILGDANCASLDVASAAVANRYAWGGVVNGNVLIAGTAPVANGAPAMVTERAIQFAAAEVGLTGLYVSLSCYYENAAPGTHVQLLEPLGQFSVQGGACHNNAHIVSYHPALNGLQDSTMSNWPCSVGTQFESFPAGNFVPWSVAMYSGGMHSSGSGVREFVDGTFGAPYILARGALLMGCGNYEQEVGEECDYGIEANGIPEAGCSATCQLSWCGDGVLNAGEDCDEGYMNGFGACPRSCQIDTAPPPPPSNRPPVARCRSVAMSAGPSCGGVSASIDDGSSDPDGDLVGCVQSVTSFELGSTVATLTCTDAQGLTASCTAPVTVVDDSAPSISCPAPSTFECGGATAQVSPAQAQDNCMTPDMSYTMSGDGFTLGTPRTVTWVASDSVSSATCSTTMTMVDTLAPSLSLQGAAQQQLECGLGSYSEAGATASDACAGDLSSRVAISGQVNPAAVGDYAVSYSVADNSGHSASAVRMVSVRDTLAPSLSLVGAPAMQLECGVDSFVNPGATAVDVCLGNLTAAIVTSGTVNAGAVGNYAVAYSVADGAGLSASAVRAVQVADTLAPSLTLNGASTVTLECGVGSYSEAGATAVDACSGNLTSAIVSSGTVNAAASGTYTRTYSVADASGNVASAARLVNVTDTRAPSISLVGSASMSVNRGSTFVDPGATAVDTCSGNLTSAIVRTGSVNTSVAGTYTLTYSVQDGAGLSASVTRTVTVEAPQSCSAISVRPAREIWPPNHKMWSFNLSACAAVVNPCGAPVDINAAGTITSIYSDEVEDAQGNGDGSTLNDIVITGPSSFKLRAERQGKGNGRFYGVNFQVTDSDGNVQTATCKFVVPHDQSGRGAIDDGAAAGYTVNAPNW